MVVMVPMMIRLTSLAAGAVALPTLFLSRVLMRSTSESLIAGPFVGLFSLLYVGALRLWNPDVAALAKCLASGLQAPPPPPRSDVAISRGGLETVDRWHEMSSAGRTCSMRVYRDSGVAAAADVAGGGGGGGADASAGGGGGGGVARDGLVSGAGADGDDVDAAEFYAEYHGHPLADLARVRRGLEARAGVKRFVWLAGDSTLDNKHWFFDPFEEKSIQVARPESRRPLHPGFVAPALNGYEAVLRPAHMVQDVSFFLNKAAAERLGANELATIMTSIEESSLSDRARAGPEGLLAQDAFIRDHIGSDDYLVVSVGGNDIALAPSLRTAVNLLLCTRAPASLIRAGVAPGLGYLIRLFTDQARSLVTRMVSKTRPRRVLFCFLYYLDENPQAESWASDTLAATGYDADPGKVQLIMRSIFEGIVRNGIGIEGTEVVPFPLFRVLDGKTTQDYVARVEPSVQGGEKMANAILDALLADPQ